MRVFIVWRWKDGGWRMRAFLKHADATRLAQEWYTVVHAVDVEGDDDAKPEKAGGSVDA